MHTRRAMSSQDQEKNDQHQSAKDQPDRNLQMHIDESDSEDDEVLKNARNTTELLRHDNGVFEDEEGREGHVLVKGGRAGNIGSEDWIGWLGGFFGRMSNRNDHMSGSDWKRGDYANVNANARPRRRGRRRASEEDEDEDMELVFDLEEGDERIRSRDSSPNRSEKNEKFMDTPAKGSFVSVTLRFLGSSV